jgi:hypothetical protein
VPNRYREQSDLVWTKVMREGMSVESVAAELGVDPARLQRLLFAIGKRRIAKNQTNLTTQRLRAHAILDRKGSSKPE